MDIMVKLCEDLQREVLTYLTSKRCTITDRFVLFRKGFSTDQFLGLQMYDNKAQNLSVIWWRKNKEGKIGVLCSIRKEENMGMDGCIGAMNIDGSIYSIRVENTYVLNIE